MGWLAWTLIWVALVLGAAGFLFLLGRDLWRKSKALVHELEAASDRLSGVGSIGPGLTQASSEPAEGH